ncbi:MAG: TetR/AcrR family transcriptional regulator [Chlamydiota bacterium]|nr:TetR/AcrR family transcriptional regulator [Chlamydiota bacterium]
MGIKERREREKQYVRTMIMKIVNQIVSEEGWGGVTIRKIAEEIEYSPPIIYEHFDSKEALLYELTKEAYGKLVKSFKSKYSDLTDPRETIHKLCENAYDFSIANKGYAKAIFGLDGVPCRVHLDIPEWQELNTLLTEKVAEHIHCSDLNDPKVFEAVNYMRWLVRGAISSAVSRIHLENKDKPFDDHDRMKKMITQSVDCMFEGFKQKSLSNTLTV